jgi:YegS/Rv2252/BmrU family lipid kinase
MSAWWVIVNPNAGRDRNLTERVMAALTVRGIDHEIRESASQEAVTAIVAEGRDRGFDAFASVGGDGTANLVVNGLLSLDWASPPTLGILPAGSGSDFIRTFAIPDHVELAADHLLDESRSPVDVGVLSGSFGKRYFLNAANAGIAARTVVEANRLPSRLGTRRYLAGFWSALAKTEPDDVRVECEGKEIIEKAWNVVVANGQFFGGGMNVAPGAATGDGRFDVQVFAGPRREAPFVIRRVVKGTHLTHPAVRRITGRSVIVDVPETWLIEADGEILGTGSFTAEVVQDRLFFKI